MTRDGWGLGVFTGLWGAGMLTQLFRGLAVISLFVGAAISGGCFYIVLSTGADKWGIAAAVMVFAFMTFWSFFLFGISLLFARIAGYLEGKTLNADGDG